MLPQNSHGQPPTILVYGTPTALEYETLTAGNSWGITIDNGKARDVVFSMYENIARADAILAFPNAHPVHLVSLIAEAEVGHPLLLNGKATGGKNFPIKPIIFCGSPEAWAPFKNIFSEMRAQGLIRDAFDHYVRYLPTVETALDQIEDRLPRSIPLTRAHYYAYSKKAADLEYQTRENSPTSSDFTVACFGSASTKNAAHLERADRYAEVIIRNNCNMLHGGGGYGVMQRLTDYGKKHNVHLTGVTVHISGAPKIYFERDPNDNRPKDVAVHVESKDMLHRIESYASPSKLFLGLDGGVGSIHEALVVAELLSKQHPVVTYKTEEGKKALKPLMVVNESGIYTPLLQYLEGREMFHLRKQIIEINSPERLDIEIKQQGRQLLLTPIERTMNENFRRGYGSADLPFVEIKPPNLDTLKGRDPQSRAPTLTP